MRRILVTGANKGIGLAICQAILEEHADAFVFLGSRDAARGAAAVAGLPKGRAIAVTLDVTDDASVAAARESIASALGGEKLYGVVNNAGIGSGSGATLAEMVQTNTFGVERISAAFLPLLEAGGRIVNITSASGPNFVATCSPEKQRFLTDRDRDLTWPKLKAFLDEAVALGSDKAAFAQRGLGQGEPYGLSKACANAYTSILARENPGYRINACTPGFIETDMTRPWAAAQNKAPAEMGMKPPAAGARAPMFLLFGEPEGSGRYYGSDAKRSPLDRYRAPGDPPYSGD